MRSLSPTPLQWYYHLFDYLMIPIMIVLSGFKLGAIQETHGWHINRTVKPDEFDFTKATHHNGTDTTKITSYKKFLFHAPIIGGWKDFIVVAPSNPKVPFYVGWTVKVSASNEPIELNVHRLLIKNGAVRMLSGPVGSDLYFFTIDQDGKQLPTKIIGHGQIGDNKYRQYRLF